MRGAWIYPPSEKQKGLLQKLILSSEFSEEEVEATEKWVSSEGATMHGAKILIDRALGRIKARDDRKRASEARKRARREKVARRRLAEEARHAIFGH